MVMAHAATMNGTGGVDYEAEHTPDSAVLTARSGDPEKVRMLTGLGFVGIMTLGGHHQAHHLAIASGLSPH
ncbi:hypothetical protein FMN50_08750 [Rhodobacterales bacterium]|nr:hypothetical protein FMN50_08750 [Rhodobacterales bacterium]